MAKRIIDISDKDFEFIQDLAFICGGRMSAKGVQQRVINAIKQSVPYTDSGYLISKDAVEQCAYTAAVIEADDEYPDGAVTERCVVDLDDIKNIPHYEKMCEEKLDKITMKVRETLLNYLDAEPYELLNLVVSIHNELYKEVTGKYYDYAYHWANLGYGGCPNDNMFKDT